MLQMDEMIRKSRVRLNGCQSRRSNLNVENTAALTMPMIRMHLTGRVKSQEQGRSHASCVLIKFCAYSLDYQMQECVHMLMPRNVELPAVYALSEH
jgi:hypothetical protein